MKCCSSLVPLQLQGLPLFQVGERGLGGLLLVVPALLVHGGEAGELQLRPAGPEGVAGGLGLDGDAVVHSGGHLTGQETAPDQLVEPELLGGQVLLDVLGHQVHVGGPDGLVGVLGVALGLIVPGLGGIILLAVAALNKALGGGDGLLGQPQGVGTHVGDEAHGALAVMSTPSYSCWAMDMVRAGVMFSFREASCWRVEVVKGGAGLRCLS